MTSEIKVLVIDDSAYNRQTITSMLEGAPGIRVVARAGDGDEGLKQVFAHAPDLITLDLEMPKMDGFTFLRILMSRRPTPVIVVSSHSRKENVFRALELGALDFIAKPTQKISPELRDIQQELLEKIRLVGQLRAVSLSPRPLGGPSAAAAGASPASASATGQAPAPGPRAAPPEVEPGELRLVVIGASTGGPPALQQIVTALDPQLPAAYLIAQHMPAKFTTAFAERLDRASALEVREAQPGDAVRAGRVLVAPGASVMTVVRGADGPVVRIDAPAPEDRFVPSIDRLFESAAEAFGEATLAVVLTGMGGDGSRGVQAVKRRGGAALAEAADTAVIFGMPEEAIRTGAVGEVLPLGQIPAAIARWTRARGRES